MAGWHVTPNDIKSWVLSNKRQAEGLLPLVIEKLVRASCSGLSSCQFPHGDEISQGGYDGMVTSAQSNSEYMVSGDSVWEIGTDSGAQKKANDDFEKRTNNPQGIDPSVTSYFHVSPRVWTKANRWKQEKQTLGVWKEVRAINSGSLSSWLSQCPAVHRWFSRVVGKRCSGLWDIEQAWSAFVSRTKVPITSDFLQYGRESSQLTTLFVAAPQSIVVSSDDVHEPYGFVLSVLRLHAEFECRALVVKNQNAWDDIAESEGNLILIAEGFLPQNIGYALSNGHHAISFATTKDAPDGSLILSRLNRQDRSAAFECLGFDESTAHDIWGETLGYFSPLCRSQFLEPIDRRKPEWINEDTSILKAALFCFEWDDGNDDDQRVLELISGKNYSALQTEFLKISNQEDPLLRKVGDFWQVISRTDAWFYLRKAIDRISIASIKDIFVEVLSEVNPLTELPVEEQYMAAVKGKIPKHSGKLKKGLGNILALLAISDDTQVVHEVEQVVAEVFSSMTTSEQWFSVGNVMSLLSEAHPDAFLSAIERQVKTDKSVFVKLFDESNSTLFGACKYSDLLWSLEVVAGNDVYFSRAVACLAELARLDPGTSSYANSPLGSLVDLFLGWVNNVSITHDERALVIQNTLTPRYPDIAYKLMTSLIRSGSGMTTGVSKARYRDWSVGIDRVVTQTNYHDYILAVTTQLIEQFFHADIVDPDRLGDILDNLHSLNIDQIEQLKSHLLEVDVDELADECRESCANRLRHFVSRHREFPDADWSAPETVISLIEAAYKIFELDDILIKNKHFFESYRIDLIQPPNRIEAPIADQQALVDQSRITALEEIFSDGGVPRVSEFIDLLTKKNHIGAYLAKVSFSKELEPALFDMVLSENGEIAGIASSYFSTIFYSDEKELIRVLNLIDKNNERLKVTILKCSPVSDQLISSLLLLNDNSQKEYWQGMGRYHLFDDEIVHLSKVVAGLLSCERYAAALDACFHMIRKDDSQEYIDPKVLADILCIMATEQDADEFRAENISYEICETIKFVQKSSKVSDEQKRRIEWLYVYPLQHHDFSPKLLVETLGNDPQFFTDLVCWLYRSKDASIQDVEESSDNELNDVAKQNRWQTAYSLIKRFKSLPKPISGDLDLAYLTGWVKSARSILDARGRTSSGDAVIGEMLSNSPDSKDKVWPHEVVRDVIEQVSSKELENGVYIGVKNSRGIVSKAMFEGGKQELELVEKYLSYSEAMKMTHPRTSKILKHISDSYAHDAEYSDNRVELSR